ncbi:solute carrier organic anion transporter family member 1B3-like isoform X1 [Cavia porcellus]|uniref:solute carrier organic anion transporter family member 1B3-like isoform X1 n=1 Tax=Cavia porcellus TaxID=10141 RepID=UPI002FE350E6
MDQHKYVNVTTETDSSEKSESRCCNRLKIFFAALSFSYVCKAFGGSIMKTSITQIERRFEIPSSVVGFIDGGFEIGSLFVIVFVSYFGSKLHRPKLIGLGCVVMGAGSILTALPHFFMGRYRYSTETHVNNTSENSLSTCFINQTTSVSETSETVSKGCEKESESYMWIYVLMGNILRGIGETPITPLGISYIDDFAEEGQSSLYIGFVNSSGIVGLVIGTIMGSLFAKMYVDIGYVDLSSIKITPQDARWVGVWWLGFLMSGLLSIISSIPFFFLPRSPDEPQKPRSNISTSLRGLKTDKQNNQPANLTDQGQGISMTDFLSSMKYLLTNRLYILYVILTLIMTSHLVGTITYVFKNLEQQYGVTASEANFYMGVIVLPTVAIGIFLGGYLVKKLKLSIVGIGKFAIFTSSMSLFIHGVYFPILCESKSVAGLTLTYDGLNPVTSHANVPLSLCNSDCNCDEHQWEPVCGSNGITYLSPCLAGCKVRGGDENPNVYYNCSCIKVSSFLNTNFSAHLGECPRDDGCKKKLYFHISVQVLLNIFVSLGATPFVLLLVRTIRPDLKSLAVGFNSLTSRTLGGMLAPIYFGAVIDTTCLKWSTTICGTRGACRMYDSALLGYSFVGMTMALKFVGVIVCIIFFQLLRKKCEGQNTKAFNNEGKITDEANLESSNDYSVPSTTLKETHM